MTNLQTPSAGASMARQEATNVAGTAAEEGKGAAAAAADAGGQVASTAAEGAKELASQTAQQAGDVKRQATEQARQFVGQAQDQLREQAESQAQRASSGLKDLSTQLRGLAEGKPAVGGVAQNGVRQLAEKVEAIAQRMDERGVDGTVDDLRRFARQRPGAFLLGAAVAGFAVVRLGKGLKEAQEDQPQLPASAAGATTPLAPAGPPPTTGRTAAAVREL